MVFPDAVGRLYSCKQSAFSVSIGDAGNMAEMPKAEPDWRRQMVQWQMYTAIGLDNGHVN